MSARTHWFRSTACGVIVAAYLSSGPLSEAQEPGPKTIPIPAVPAARETTPNQPKDGFLPPTPRAQLMAPVDANPPAATTPQPACTENSKSAWLTNPPYPVIPRPGNFYVPPTGCGYYSALDWLKHQPREGPPNTGDRAPGSGYPAFAIMPFSLFDADFRYVDDPNYTPDFLDSLHRIHLGDDWMVGTGGQAQWRHMHEYSSRLTGKTNDYDLFRARIFGEVWYKDTFRIYAEIITAGTANQDLPPLRIDENRFDFQNLFVDVKIGEFEGGNAYLRIGRQELLLGSQRLISPLDWANTRRTFQGVRGLWSNDNWDLTAFWVQPVIPDNAGMSSVDYHQNFYGAWATYRPVKGTALDAYYLFLDNANHTTQAGIITTPTSVHTLGSRFSGDKNSFLWDFEGMYQLGAENGQPLRAGSATAGLGYNAKNLPMNPTVWAYYDWASGDHNPNSGNYDTFNQLFPFGHYYFGFLDLVGRQNIRDWNMHLYLNPTKWITFNAQYHFFSLDSATDALYGASGLPLRVSLKGTAGGVVGQELDLFANFHLSNRTDLCVGYSKLNAGEFISNTGNGKSPELFYVMYNIRW